MSLHFDVLVVGAGAAGLSCALLLGSGLSRQYAQEKKVGIITHQKASHLQSALLNNVLGIPAGTSGKQLLEEGKRALGKRYPEVEQIEKQKVREVLFLNEGYEVVTNKSRYTTKQLVIAVGYADHFDIKGLEGFVEPHLKSKPSKMRVQLRNTDQLVRPGLYVAGSLAGHRSQYAIASGSGAAVATDILTSWNGGQHTQVHDKL